MFNEAKTTELFEEELELSHFHVAIFNYKMSSMIFISMIQRKIAMNFS